MIIEYIDALKLLKTATKRLEGRGKSSAFRAITEIILVFEYLLSYYEQRYKPYKYINYNAHPKTLEDYFVINIRVA